MRKAMKHWSCWQAPRGRLWETHVSNVKIWEAVDRWRVLVTWQCLYEKITQTRDFQVAVQKSESSRKGIRIIASVSHGYWWVGMENGLKSLTKRGVLGFLSVPPAWLILPVYLSLASSPFLFHSLPKYHPSLWRFDDPWSWSLKE